MSGGSNYLPNFLPISFSGVYLVLWVFRDIWPSNKENRSVYWHATLSCPSWPQIMQICISSRSRFDLVLDADHALDFFYLISLFRRASRFIVFSTKVAPECFCLVRLKMPLLTCRSAPFDDGGHLFRQQHLLKILQCLTPLRQQSERDCRQGLDLKKPKS